MSVIVKGMEMPEECNACPLANYNMGTMYCKALTPSPKGFHIIKFEGRREDCPLVEVKEPHGRLIDVDEPMTKISTMMQEPDYQHDGENWMVGLIMARDAIDDAPTVIEAEGETDGR